MAFHRGQQAQVPQPAQLARHAEACKPGTRRVPGVAGSTRRRTGETSAVHGARDVIARQKPHKQPGDWEDCSLMCREIAMRK